MDTTRYESKVVKDGTLHLDPIFPPGTSCEQPPPPIGGTQTCTTHPDGISCTVQCSTYQHQPAMPSPVVYTCNTYTPWQPGQTDGPFRYPACTGKLYISECVKLQALLMHYYKFIGVVYCWCHVFIVFNQIRISLHEVFFSSSIFQA